MKQLSIGILFFFLANTLFGQDLTTKFQNLLDSKFAENDSAVGISIHVEAPDLGISWTGTAGNPEKNTTTPLDKETPVLIASNTKTYVAAAILKLIENNKFQLNDPIQNLISEASNARLWDAGYQTANITIKHLLSHTSGIADYVDDNYFDFVDKNQKYAWTRDEQTALSTSTKAPLAEPGTAYKYADINFVLLTEVIEKFTNQGFYNAIPELLEFKINGLEKTRFVKLTALAANEKPLAHQYLEKRKWDSSKIDPSWDLYGGGGLVANTKDMARFFQLLFTGKIVKDPKLIKEMHTLIFDRETSKYCLGVNNILFSGYETYYHGGFWGTDVLYIPALNLSIAAFTLEKGQRDAHRIVSIQILELIAGQD